MSERETVTKSKSLLVPIVEMKVSFHALIFFTEVLYTNTVGVSKFLRNWLYIY
jgi:hypothetical protein